MQWANCSNATNRVFRGGTGPGLNATDNNLDSVVLIYKGRMYHRSRAALHTLLLHRAWPLLGVFLLVPRLIADPVYDYIDRHR